MPIAKRLQTGVYRIINIFNEKIYVGSAVKGFGKRWYGHIEALRAGRHYNKHLQAAWIKYGEDAFMFEVLEGLPVEKCLDVETQWIKALNSANSEFGYNKCLTGGSMLGYKFSDEARAAMSVARKGRKHTEEAKEKIGKAAIGRNKGKVHSEESKANMSAGRIGMKLSEEHRRAIGNAHKGRKLAEEHKLKIRISNLGKKRSEETRERVRLSKLGVKPSEEARRKRSASMKLAWARRRAERGIAQDE